MCALKIFTNEDICAATEERQRFGHLGTRDSQTPGAFFDYPGKTAALVEAAHTLAADLRSENSGVHPLSIQISQRVPSKDQLLVGHSETYLSSLEATSVEALRRAKAGECYFMDFGEDADVSPGTYQAALRSVGTAFDAIDHVMNSPGSTAFALVWPPGHHAEPSAAMGFCYLSTAALATLYARDHGARSDQTRSNRVVLIDIDHHCGNGSAAVLAHQNGVLFVDQFYRSEYDERSRRYVDGNYDPTTNSYRGCGREYPYSRNDAFLGVKAHRTTAAPNILPVEFQGFQEARDVESRFNQDVLPKVVSFNPDIVLWSIGLDSAKGDPLGGLGLEPDSYYRLIKTVRATLPGARHCGILEGGYHLTISPACLRQALLALHE